jgi:hypothetical protein
MQRWKAGGFLHKSGTVKILPAYGITVCIPEKQRSTDLYGLVQKIEGSLNQKEFALGVFMDIDQGKQCQGARKSGMPTGSSTVPSVVEHGGGISTS